MGTVSGIVALALAAVMAAQPRHISPDRSVFTVHVYKAGALSFAGHEHAIEAHGIRGTVNDVAGAEAIDLVVPAMNLMVVDSGISEDDRQKILETMRTQVLDVEHYPEIRFRSTAVKPIAPGKWEVDGMLTLHGQSQRVKLPVHAENDGYAGEVRLKQTDYGIEPVKAAGGTIKVKDELLVGFRIALE